MITQVGKNTLGNQGGLGGLVTFFAHIEAKREESDDGGESNGGYAHGYDDFGEAERRWKAAARGLRVGFHGLGASVGRARPVYLVRRMVSKLVILELVLIVAPVTVPSKNAIPLVGNGLYSSDKPPSG